MLVQIVTLPIRPEKFEEAITLFTELAEASREEDGINVYYPTTKIETPNTIVMIEEFVDETAFKTHREQEHFKQALPRLSEILAGAPEFRRYWVSDAKVQNQP